MKRKKFQKKQGKKNLHRKNGCMKMQMETDEGDKWR